MIGGKAGSRPVRRAGGDLDDSKAASEDAAHAAALWLLESRARTRLELQQRLERRGFERGAIERALDRLSSVGLVDDEAFARDLAASRVEQGVDASRIVVELKDRGIAPELAARVAGEQAPQHDREDRCRELAEARLAKLQGLRPDVQLRRLAGYLVRRGYPGDVVENVVSELIASSGYGESGEEEEYDQI
ncbi:MAG TPA: regulatory protein RecX [Actinomycetes bacterium]|nr:regulatory protein RecX [Actinomycetes bacterium]